MKLKIFKYFLLFIRKASIYVKGGGFNIIEIFLAKGKYFRQECMRQICFTIKMAVLLIYM